MLIEKVFNVFDVERTYNTASHVNCDCDYNLYGKPGKRAQAIPLAAK